MRNGLGKGRVLLATNSWRLRIALKSGGQESLGSLTGCHPACRFDSRVSSGAFVQHFERMRSNVEVYADSSGVFAMPAWIGFKCRHHATTQSRANGQGNGLVEKRYYCKTSLPGTFAVVRNVRSCLERLLRSPKTGRSEPPSAKSARSPNEMVFCFSWRWRTCVALSVFRSLASNASHEAYVPNGLSKTCCIECSTSPSTRIRVALVTASWPKSWPRFAAWRSAS